MHQEIASDISKCEEKNEAASSDWTSPSKMEDICEFKHSGDGRLAYISSFPPLMNSDTYSTHPLHLMRTSEFKQITHVSPMLNGTFYVILKTEIKKLLSIPDIKDKGPLNPYSVV